MYNNPFRHCGECNWTEPPCVEVIEDMECPECNAPMEWQKNNFQFYCCACDECWNHPDDNYYEPADEEMAYGY